MYRDPDSGLIRRAHGLDCRVAENRGSGRDEGQKIALANAMVPWWDGRASASVSVEQG